VSTVFGYDVPDACSTMTSLGGSDVDCSSLAKAFEGALKMVAPVIRIKKRNIDEDAVLHVLLSMALNYHLLNARLTTLCYLVGIPCLDSYFIHNTDLLRRCSIGVRKLQSNNATHPAVDRSRAL
jgi:hypothetical protein